MKRFYSILALFMVLAFSNAALADSQGVRMEVTNDSEFAITATLSVLDLTESEDIAKKIEPGATVVFSKVETMHETGGTFVGWTITFGDHCSFEIMAEGNGCNLVVDRCGASSIETVGSCSYKVRALRR